MAETTPPSPPADRIEDLQIEQELQDSYLTYAMSTIMDRALPDVRDGLKPSQRRILVAMNDLNLRPGSKHLKCAKIAGDTSGNYHPHGEAVVYPTLVRLAQDWNLRYTADRPPGQLRQHRRRPARRHALHRGPHDRRRHGIAGRSRISTPSISSPTTTNDCMEPTVLPGKFPNLLVNGSTGIAVGMACNLLPHNLREICDAIVHVINNPDCDLPELLEIVPGPRFPHRRDHLRPGRNRRGIHAPAAAGSRSAPRSRSKTQKNGKSLVVIEEIPYGVIRKIDRRIGRRVREEGRHQRHLRDQR